MRFKWQTILQHGGRMLRARGWCSASRGWAGAADWTHWLMKPVQKRFRNQNTEAGTNSSSQQKKKKKEMKKKTKGSQIGCPVSQPCKPMWPCRCGWLGQLRALLPVPQTSGKRTGKQEKSVGRTKETPRSSRAGGDLA